MPAHLIAEIGPKSGSILKLEGAAEWIIGRDPDTCDFYIDDSTVSRKHARLNATPDGIYIKNLSQVNPTLVNEDQADDARLLREGDRIQVGSTVFLYSEEDISETGKPPLKPKKKNKKEEEEESKADYDDIFGDIDAPIEELEEDLEEDANEDEPPIDEEAPEDSENPVIEAEELRIPPAPSKPEMTAYDTIFEDAGSEEELPFNLGIESPLLLKVIAGPNAGAEIGIEKGRTYTIGKDSNTSDIVFQDLSVSRNHALLTVNSDGIIDIEDLESKNGVAVNGEVITDKQNVTTQDLVALGTTVFMIIDREAPQDTIYSPMLPTYEAATPEEEKPEEKKEKKRDWKKEPIPMKHLALGGSAAAIFLIVFLSFFSLFKSSGIEIVENEPVSEIKDALKKFEDVQFSFSTGSGKLFLVGHVLTPVDYQEMNYRLSQINFIHRVEDNVVIDEGVWKMMNDVLSDNPLWRGVSIHSPKAGKFVVNGYIKTTQEAMQLYEYLTVNFPYLDRLENNVVIEENLQAQLLSLISQDNLGAVSFKLNNGNVVLSGQYAEDMKSNMNSLIKEINKVKGVTSVKNFATAIHQSKLGLDISKDFHVTGSSTFDGRGFSAILNGKIYTLGDSVEGMTITSIDPNTILLEKDGLKYKIDYTR